MGALKLIAQLLTKRFQNCAIGDGILSQVPGNIKYKCTINCLCGFPSLNHKMWTEVFRPTRVFALCRRCQGKLKEMAKKINEFVKIGTKFL